MEIRFCVFKRTANGLLSQSLLTFLCSSGKYSHQLLNRHMPVLNLVSGGNTLFHDPHTATLPNFLSAGIISRPSIVSLMTGDVGAGLE